MHFHLLASGSYGNSTVIKFKNATFMVDVGLTIKEITEKLDRIGYKIEDMDAVFITHEHSDHIKSIKCVDLEKVYGTKETYEPHQYNFVEPFKMYEVKGIKVVPIPMSHDVKNGVGYIFDDGEERLVYLTDTGYVNKKIYPFIENADHYIFESNHDVDQLLKTNRPFFLKQRILSDNGHLSNEDSADILSNVIGNSTKSIILAHVSEDANTKDKVMKAITNTLCNKGFDISKIDIQVADRYDITFGGNKDEISK